MPKGYKNCPECQEPMHVRRKVCTNCGHTFIIGARKRAKRGSSNAVETRRPAAKAATPPRPVLPKRPVLRRSGSGKGASKFTVVHATDEREIHKFVDALLNALNAAKVSGGIYSAFLPVKEGKLQIEIQTFTGREEI